MRFSRFPVLPGSAKAQVIWGGIVKSLLTAYFIGNTSAKKYQTPFTCVKVIASQKWDVFETHRRDIDNVFLMIHTWRGLCKTIFKSILRKYCPEKRSRHVLMVTAHRRIWSISCFVYLGSFIAWRTASIKKFAVAVIFSYFLFVYLSVKMSYIIHTNTSSTTRLQNTYSYLLNNIKRSTKQ